MISGSHQANDKAAYPHARAALLKWYAKEEGLENDELQQKVDRVMANQFPGLSPRPPEEPSALDDLG